MIKSTKFYFGVLNYNILALFCRKPQSIWLSGLKEMWIVIKDVRSLILPSLALGCSWNCILMCKHNIQNLEGRDSWHALQKSSFLFDLWSKLNGVFCKVWAMSYSFNPSNCILDWFTIFKVIVAEGTIVIFWWGHRLWMPKAKILIWLVLCFCLHIVL